MAAARSLVWPASRLTRRHTAATPKHLHCFSVHFPSSGDVSVYWLWLLLDISALSVVIVIIAIWDMPKQEFSLRERVYIHNT